MGPTLKQLSVFAGVVEYRGFGAAADQLGMGQSAVSHTLSALEKSVGAPLVTRTAPVRPTELGKALLPHAHSALAAARSIDSLISNHRRVSPAGGVKIAVSPTVAHGLMPQLLTRWRADLPDVDVRIFEAGDDELSDWLESGVVDCAILVDPSPEPTGGVELLTDVFQAVLRTDHPFSSLGEVELTDLLEDPLLISSSGCEAQIRQLHRTRKVPFSPAQRVRETATLLSMVEGDLGVAIMPSLAGSMLPESLVMVDLLPRLERRLVFSGPTGRVWHPCVARMRDIAAAEPLRAPARARV